VCVRCAAARVVIAAGFTAVGSPMMGDWEVGQELIVNLPRYLGGTVHLKVTGVSEQYGHREYHAVTVPDGRSGDPHGYEAQEADAAQGQDSGRFERDDGQEDAACVRAEEEEAPVEAIARQLKGHRGTSPVAKRAQLEDLVRYVLHLARWSG
jgi:hypothetical protein